MLSRDTVMLSQHDNKGELKKLQEEMDLIRQKLFETHQQVRANHCGQDRYQVSVERYEPNTTHTHTHIIIMIFIQDHNHKTYHNSIATQ